jgi:hypothetical protein
MHTIRVLDSIAAILPATTVGTGDQRPATDLRFLAQLEPGQRLRATVQASLSSTKFAVMLSPDGENALAGQTVHMKLPLGTQPGDHLNLVFIGREPRPHFALVTDLPLQADIPRLSETSRFIDDLLHDPSCSQASCFEGGLFATSAARRSWSCPCAWRALEQSGFSMNRIETWIAGTRTFAELLLEPQDVVRSPGSRALRLVQTIKRRPRPVAS